MDGKCELEAAIVIISDTAHEKPFTDRTADILDDVLKTEGNGQWAVCGRDIVPDDVVAIQRTITRLTDGDINCNLLITSGGTGFAIKDHTPEAVTPLIHRHASGLV